MQDTMARSLLRMVLAAVAAIVCAGALVLVASPRAFADPASSEYQGGTIPILRLTFADDVDPDTGDVVLSGDEKIQLMLESPNHVYRATGVSLDLEVPSTYDNPEEGLWDGTSGYIGESDLALEFVRGRGNSTWRVAKKPLKIKLDKKANLFGMGSNKHWTLLANYYDSSLSIDRIVGWLGDEMGMPYTPRGVPVDLFMNGEYYGNYLLAEEVRVDGSRVDIDEVDAEASDPESTDITGDYLLGMSSKPTAQPGDYFTTSRGTMISYDTPEYPAPLTGAQEAQQAYLKTFFDQLEDAIYADDVAGGNGRIWNLMDRDSLADYWLIQEFTNNPDAFATPSTYFYKLRDQVAADGTVTPGKLYWGPLWDFDFVWGQLGPEGFESESTEWVSLLRQDPGFVELLKERWRVLDDALGRLTEEGGLLDRYIAEMSASWEADKQRWPHEDTHEWADGSYAETIEELRDHVDARRAWINDNLDLLQTKYVRLGFAVDDDEVFSTKVRVGDGNWFDMPEAPDKEGKFFDGWFTDDHEEFDRDKAYQEDTVFHAVYLDNSEVSKATDIFLAQDELWVWDAANVVFDIAPSDARDRRIVWSSSDESIVTVRDGFIVVEDGCLGGADTVEATVTARLAGSGVEKTMRVVVYDPERITLPEPESISFESGIELKAGEYEQLSWTTEPSPNALDENFNLFFKVDDESIATCSGAGVVTGKSPGTTTITVTRPYPPTWDEVAVATVTVTVTEGGVEPGPAPTPDDETFSIVYKLNGGSVDGSTADIVEQHKAGETITIPDAPERDGYVFLYWRGSAYKPGDSYLVTGDHTFTAQWVSDGTAGGGGSDATDGNGNSNAKTTSGKAAATNVRSSGSSATGTGSAGTMTATGDGSLPLLILAGIALAVAIAACTRALVRR
ncbi:MAG: CotH kinase family protein [Coriobacteriales bacterium]|jgi:hypothetical protein